MAAFGYLAYCEDDLQNSNEDMNWAAVGRLQARDSLGNAHGRRRAPALGATSTRSKHSHNRRDIHLDAVNAEARRSTRRPSAYLIASDPRDLDLDHLSTFSSGPRRTPTSQRPQSKSSPQPPSSFAKLDKSSSRQARRSSNTDGPIISSLAANVVNTTNSIYAAQVGRSRHSSVSSTSTNSSVSSTSSTSENSAIPPIPRKATARSRAR